MTRKQGGIGRRPQRKPVKVGLVVDERAYSPDITTGMHVRPSASLAAHSIIGISHWQVALFSPLPYGHRWHR